MGSSDVGERGRKYGDVRSENQVAALFRSAQTSARGWPTLRARGPWLTEKAESTHPQIPGRDRVPRQTGDQMSVSPSGGDHQ